MIPKMLGKIDLFPYLLWIQVYLLFILPVLNCMDIQVSSLTTDELLITSYESSLDILHVVHKKDLLLVCGRG